MSWLRIDDAVMDHPKILMLNDAQFRLWMRGLCYCQKHLTDGLLSDLAVKSIFGKAESVKRLVDAKLWDLYDGGFAVHDYLDWNDSRELTLQRKDAAEVKKVAHRAKMERYRDLKKEKREAVCAVAQNEHKEGTVPLYTTVHHTTPQKDEERPPRKELPVFKGSRFDLFQWQIDEWGRMLGPATVIDPFTWAQEKDRELSQSAQVVPKESHGWLTKLLETDAAKHGMSIGRASDIHAIQPLPRPRNCKHSPPCASEDVHTSRYITEQRMA